MAISTIVNNNKGIQASTNAWHGDKLVFDIPRNNVQLWELTVMAVTYSGDALGKVTFCIRNSDANLHYSNFGVITLTPTYDFNTNQLTVNLPYDSFWSYSLNALSYTN